MKNGLTELVFILDKSGSMSGLESDTIGGFNSLVERQKQEEGECLVTTVLFSSNETRIHDRVPLDKVPKMTEKDYVVGGCTALIDAIGNAVNHISEIHRYARPEDVPEHTVFVITTDGYENASHKFTSNEVKKAIEKKKKEGWEFTFLGANIDAVETAASFGIDKEDAVNYCADSKGVDMLYCAVSANITSQRAGKGRKKDWAKEITEDYEARGGEKGKR